MPIYEYACPACGGFAALRPLAEYQRPAECPQCGGAAPRATLTAPALAAMPAARRQAHAVNEQARHEPKRASRLDQKHGAGCGCCSGRSSAKLTAQGEKSFPARRPWMISH